MKSYRDIKGKKIAAIDENDAKMIAESHGFEIEESRHDDRIYLVKRSDHDSVNVELIKGTEGFYISRVSLPSSSSYYGMAEGSEEVPEIIENIEGKQMLLTSLHKLLTDLLIE